MSELARMLDALVSGRTPLEGLLMGVLIGTVAVLFGAVLFTVIFAILEHYQGGGHG